MAPLAPNFTWSPLDLPVSIAPSPLPGPLCPLFLDSPEKNDFDDAVIIISTDDEEPSFEGEGFASTPIKI